jgi:hypothetical protein
MSWSFLCSGSSVRIIDDCLFCRCRGVSCVQTEMGELGLEIEDGEEVYFGL